MASSPTVLRRLAAAAFALLVATLPASAQQAQPGGKPIDLSTGNTKVPPLGIPYAPQPPSFATQPVAPLPPVGGSTAIVPPALDLPAPKTDRATLKLKALVTEDGQPIKSGLVWRIFQEAQDNGDDARMKLIATSAGGEAQFRLDPGSYLVHAAYGRAGATTRVNIERMNRDETLILNAGGVRLNAAVIGDLPIDIDRVTFDIYSRDNDQRGDRQALVIGAKAGRIIRLNADTYYIVSRYGDLNATVRAEIHVNPGKLTEATVYHKAAKATLKLVGQPGGEALANVSWLILTPAGDQVAESVGAFPTIVLAEGDYSVVAKHLGQVYTRSFSVEPGYDREWEIVADKAKAP
jgi:hypothetical protein